MTEVERFRQALEQIAKMKIQPWRQDELMQSIAKSALAVPTDEVEPLDSASMTAPSDAPRQ